MDQVILYEHLDRDKSCAPCCLGRSTLTTVLIICPNPEKLVRVEPHPVDATPPDNGLANTALRPQKEQTETACKLQLKRSFGSPALFWDPVSSTQSLEVALVLFSRHRSRRPYSDRPPAKETMHFECSPESRNAVLSRLGLRAKCTRKHSSCPPVRAVSKLSAQETPPCLPSSPPTSLLVHFFPAPSSSASVAATERCPHSCLPPFASGSNSDFAPTHSGRSSLSSAAQSSQLGSTRVALHLSRALHA